MQKKDSWRRRDQRLTARAKRIYQAIFNKPLGKNWVFIWYFLGATDHRCKQLMLVDGLEDKDAMDTLCHEFVHVRFPKMRHGKSFDALVKKMTPIALSVK